jgi:hypothetical protein
VVGRADSQTTPEEHQEQTPYSLLFRPHVAKMEDGESVENSFDVDLADKIKVVCACQYLFIASTNLITNITPISPIMRSDRSVIWLLFMGNLS